MNTSQTGDPWPPNNQWPPNNWFAPQYVAPLQAKADLADRMAEWARENHHAQFHSNKRVARLCDVCNFLADYDRLNGKPEEKP